MSYSFDVNVLLYASDRSSDRHEAARQFLESCAARHEVICLTWPTLMAYLRIATHPSIFAAPLAPEEALSNIGALLALPHVRVVSEVDGFMDAYRHVTAATTVTFGVGRVVEAGAARSQPELAAISARPTASQQVARQFGTKSRSGIMRTRLPKRSLQPGSS